MKLALSSSGHSSGGQHCVLLPGLPRTCVFAVTAKLASQINVAASGRTGELTLLTQFALYLFKCCLGYDFVGSLLHPCFLVWFHSSVRNCVVFPPQIPELLIQHQCLVLFSQRTTGLSSKLYHKIAPGHMLPLEGEGKGYYPIVSSE